MKANKYLYVFLMMMFCAGSADVLANTARIEGEGFNGNRSWSGPHATFTISGGKTASTTVGADGRKLQIKEKTTCVIKWEVEENCTIEVTKIQTKIGAPLTGFDLYFNEIKCGSVGGWSTRDNVYLADLTLGNEDSITVRGTSSQVNLYYIEITYTITPNAPELAVSEDSIFVAIEPETEETDSVSADSVAVELIKEVYLPAKFVTNEHFAIEIEMVENPNGMGVVTEDSVFYSTEVGTYTFRARYMSVDGCHKESAWSEVYTVYVLPIEEETENGENDENGDEPGIATGLYDLQSQNQAHKFLRGNVIYVRRGDALFTIDGRRVE